MRVLGLDSGIASIGWALIEVENPAGDEDARGRILGAGVWMFEPPEEKTQNGSRSKSEIRQNFRSQRRVLRRRRQRMAEIRRMFVRRGLLPRADRDALRLPGLDPWRLRAEALERPLQPVEFAVALGHIARHRGFKSNARDAETRTLRGAGSAMDAAIASTREKLTHYRTPAHMLCVDDRFLVSGTSVRRLRNREGDHSRTQLRVDIESEARALFRAQARLRAAHATPEFEAEFAEAAFFQRPLRNGQQMVGYCCLEPDERRSPKRGYSFERFRCLSRLVNLTLLDAGAERRLSVDEIRVAIAGFGASAKFTYFALRRKLNLEPRVSFVGVSREEERRRDFVARCGEAAAGTNALRNIITAALGEAAWSELLSFPERLDRIAEIVSFHDKSDLPRKEFLEAGCDAALTGLLVNAAKVGALDIFAGAGHICAKAARDIIPGLLQGFSYNKACALAGYDHRMS